MTLPEEQVPVVSYPSASWPPSWPARRDGGHVADGEETTGTCCSGNLISELRSQHEGTSNVTDSSAVGDVGGPRRAQSGALSSSSFERGAAVTALGCPAMSHGSHAGFPWALRHAPHDRALPRGTLYAIIINIVLRAATGVTSYSRRDLASASSSHSVCTCGFTLVAHAHGGHRSSRGLTTAMSPEHRHAQSTGNLSPGSHTSRRARACTALAASKRGMHFALVPPSAT